MQRAFSVVVEQRGSNESRNRFGFGDFFRILRMRLFAAAAELPKLSEFADGLEAAVESSSEAGAQVGDGVECEAGILVG